MRIFSIRTALTAPLLSLGLLGAVALGGALAQPESGECDLEPLTLPLFAATPAAQIAATPAATSPGVVPDEETIREAIDTIVECVNTGEPSYQYAIFTERYLAGQFADPAETYQPQFEYDLSLGPADVVPVFELVSASDITILADGRVSVTVEVASAGTTYRDIFTLANVDGVWLVDEVEQLDPSR